MFQDRHLLHNQSSTPSFADSIIVEKVNVKCSLNNPEEISHIRVLVVCLVVCPVNPVENVQSSVKTKGEDVVSSEVLNFTVSLENNELGDDSS